MSTPSLRQYPQARRDAELLLIPIEHADLDALTQEGLHACTHRVTLGPRSGAHVEKLV